MTTETSKVAKLTGFGEQSQYDFNYNDKLPSMKALSMALRHAGTRELFIYRVVDYLFNTEAWVAENPINTRILGGRIGKIVLHNFRRFAHDSAELVRNPSSPVGQFIIHYNEEIDQFKFGAGQYEPNFPVDGTGEASDKVCQICYNRVITEHNGEAILLVSLVTDILLSMLTTFSYEIAISLNILILYSSNININRIYSLSEVSL